MVRSKTNLSLFSLFSLFSLLRLSSGLVPLFQEVYVGGQFPGIISHVVLAADQTAFVAGVSYYDFSLEEMTDEQHVFFGRFANNDFIWAKTVENRGGDVPKVFDLAPTDTGVILIATYSSTMIFDGAYEPYLYVEETDQTHSVFIASISDYGEAFWVNSVGVDWKKSHGPFTITAAKGFEDEVILVGNYFRHVRLGDKDLGGEPRAQTFFIVFDSLGDDISLLYTPHKLATSCSPNPCQNGGVCEVNYFTEGFYCECPEPFDGDLCEHELEPDNDNQEEKEGENKNENENQEEENDDNDDYDYEDDLGKYDEDDPWSYAYDDEDQKDDNQKGEGEGEGEGRRRRRKREEGGEKKTRTSFTQTETLDTPDGMFLFGAGFSLDEMGYSNFISKYLVDLDSIEKEWTVTFFAGTKTSFPSLEAFQFLGSDYVAFAGTYSIQTDFQGHHLDIDQTESRRIFAGLLDSEGKVLWVRSFSGVGDFHDMESLYIPITANCSGSNCEILLGGPSSLLTSSQDVKIDVWEGHLYFLASIDFAGNVKYIKEIFPDAEFGEIRSLEMSPSGNVWLGGSVGGGGIHFDWEPTKNADLPALLIAKVGFIPEKHTSYEKYVAPVIYSPKSRPKISFGLFLSFSILLFLGVRFFLRGGRC